MLLIVIVGLGTERILAPIVIDLLSDPVLPGEEAHKPSLLMTVSFMLFHSLVVLWIIRRVTIVKYGLSWRDLGFVAIDRSWIGRAATMAVISVPLVTLINLTVLQSVEGPVENPQIDIIAPVGFTWPAFISMTLLAGVLVPIVEETAFRGLLYPWLRDRMGVPWAIFFSALCFASFHRMLYFIPAITVLGIILAFVREKSDSLWPPIIVHGGFNTAMTIILYSSLAEGNA